MKLGTKVVGIVEITQSEYDDLWKNFYTNGHRWTNGDHTIVMWWNDDGHNAVLIEGEDTLRDLHIIDAK